MEKTFDRHPIYQKLTDLKNEIKYNPTYDLFWQNKNKKKNKYNDMHHYLNTYYQNMQEINETHHIIKDNIRYLDLCCAPGGFAKYIMTNFKNIIGLGVTLPSSQGGQKMGFRHDQFKCIFKDVNHYIPGHKYDLVICGGTYFRQKYQSRIECEKQREQLLSTQFKLAIHSLNEKGTLMIKMNNKIDLINIKILIYSFQLFEEIKIAKPENDNERSFYFLLCFNFNYDHHLIQNFKFDPDQILLDNHFDQIGNLLSPIWTNQIQELEHIKHTH